MAKNITINFKTVYDDKGIKSATMSLSDLEKVAKNVQKSIDSAGANIAASWSVMAEGFGRGNCIDKAADERTGRPRYYFGGGAACRGATVGHVPVSKIIA